MDTVGTRLKGALERRNSQGAADKSRSRLGSTDRGVLQIRPGTRNRISQLDLVGDPQAKDAHNATLTVNPLPTACRENWDPHNPAQGAERP